MRRIGRRRGARCGSLLARPARVPRAAAWAQPVGPPQHIGLPAWPPARGEPHGGQGVSRRGVRKPALDGAGGCAGARRQHVPSRRGVRPPPPVRRPATGCAGPVRPRRGVRPPPPVLGGDLVHAATICCPDEAGGHRHACDGRRPGPHGHHMPPRRGVRPPPRMRRPATGCAGSACAAATARSGHGHAAAAGAAAAPGPAAESGDLARTLPAAGLAAAGAVAAAHERVSRRRTAGLAPAASGPEAPAPWACCRRGPH